MTPYDRCSWNVRDLFKQCLSNYGTRGRKDVTDNGHHVHTRSVPWQAPGINNAIKHAICKHHKIHTVNLNEPLIMAKLLFAGHRAMYRYFNLEWAVLHPTEEMIYELRLKPTTVRCDVGLPLSGPRDSPLSGLVELRRGLKWLRPSDAMGTEAMHTSYCDDNHTPRVNLCGVQHFSFPDATSWLCVCIQLGLILCLDLVDKTILNACRYSYSTIILIHVSFTFKICHE